MVLTVQGDTDRALTMVVGAQHTNDQNHLFFYWTAQMLAGQFETALAFAQKWTTEWEVGLLYIQLRDSFIAETLMAMARDDEAKSKAREVLDRLDKMRQQGIDDFRVSAQAMIAYGILGDKQKVSELVDKVLSTKPADAVEDLKFRYQFAQAYAHAGMNTECIETLELLLSGKSTISVPWLELDPAFKDIRNTPEFIALLERHR